MGEREKIFEQKKKLIQQEEYERSVQQMKDMEAAHKENMAQFQAKIKADQYGETI